MLGLLLAAALPAQLNTGTLEGTLRSADGQPRPDTAILITGGPGLRATIHTNAQGDFSITLPYGLYSVAGAMSVFVSPMHTARCDLTIDPAGTIHGRTASSPAPGTWDDTTRGQLYPEGFSLQGLLLSREPSSVTQPLDFSGLSDNRLAVESQRGLSWTHTQFKINGMDATDSYQPGLPRVLADVHALDDVVVRDAFVPATTANPGVEIGLFLSEPRAPSNPGFPWHGTFSTADSGSSLSSSNLPAPANRGIVRQAEQFRWFTRDHLEIGGPVARWADLFASGTGQWDSQTEPLAAPGTAQGSRILFGNARGRVRAGSRDLFDALYSGSRINLTDGGIPVGIEALSSNRLSPSFTFPGGFPGEEETDHLDFLQAGWTHLPLATSRLGTFELRYGFAIAHLNTGTQQTGESRVELLGGEVTGAPPLANLAVRTRQEIEGAWQPAEFRLLGVPHKLVTGAGWKTSDPRNRFTNPSGMNLVTVNGVPASLVEFNTPLNSRELVRSSSIYLDDRLSLTRAISIHLGAVADLSRGSLPAQSSPEGAFTPPRNFASHSDVIVWNCLSPRAGLAAQVPHLRGLVLRAAYSRFYEPLAGRYLDFANPNSLGGSVYQWVASDPNAPFQPAERGSLLLRFGGPYSSISPALRRPYSDEFELGAELRVGQRGSASILLFRRDDKNRIAALDTGVPAQAYTPVSILDPGPDDIPGTFDDQRLTVYAQNPATLGQDHYLLTNPIGLRNQNTGLVAEVGMEWRRLMLHASFVAEKSYGPTNPGNGVYENDPGVIGSLFLDPNSAINAGGRSFVDRAYVGKVQAVYHLSRAWGGMDLSSVATYTDGLAFARQLLVTGLPQGSFLVAATVRGSPGGGNRTQYALNWNLRFSRKFKLARRGTVVFADIMNLTNAGQRLQEEDLTGTSFNLRLPVAIQPPRFVRIGFSIEF